MAICGKATPNCTLWALGLDDSLVQADPDIAGIGIVISFIATSCVTILIALVSFLLGLIREERDNAIDAWVMKHLQKSTVLRARIERTDFWQPIVEGLALNLSDQQLLVGISILVAGSYGLLVDRASLSTETEGNENEWGFGQIVPLLLLSSTIMLFKELYTDQKAKLSAQALDKNGNSLISLRNSLRSERTISDDGSQHVTIGAVEPIFTSPRRVDTEAGGHEDISGMSLQRRPTAHALLDRTSQ
ncbi:MAG: hypothetical protein L6R41_001221 [Letrouitia leprolyta]|nr:MAG: hypothetical protein L6R41_001221 [Letrouitia leprolyta]